MSVFLQMKNQDFQFLISHLPSLRHSVAKRTPTDNERSMEIETKFAGGSGDDK